MKEAVTFCTLLVMITSLVAKANGDNMCSAFCTALGMLSTSPGKSCNDIYQINKATRGVSGYYWIQTDSGTTQEVYCDMELECGGHKGGWMRVAQLDTTNGDSCPGDWINNADYNSLCTGVDSPGCHSANFSVPYNYNKICGQLRGFQKGSPDSFYPYTFARGLTNMYVPDTFSKTVNGVYVDGVSITLGDPRKHVWTYAVGASDDYDYPYFNCPCANNSLLEAPVFVGNNYYCESGNIGTFSGGTLYSEDALWDGEQCLPDNSCCDKTSQPWFFHQLSISVKEHLEVRICKDQPRNEDVTVEKLQLFIQ